MNVIILQAYHALLKPLLLSSFPSKHISLRPALALSRILRTWKDSMSLWLWSCDTVAQWKSQTGKEPLAEITFPIKNIEKATINVPSLFQLRKTWQSQYGKIKQFWHLRNSAQGGTSSLVLQMRNHLDFYYGSSEHVSFFSMIFHWLFSYPVTSCPRKCELIH